MTVRVKSGTRREKARATRRTIICAAREEFLQHGFHGATVARIAATAGVAPQTVYFIFHSKPELISAVIDDAVMGDDDEVPQATKWWAAMQTTPSADEALRIFIRGSAPLFARASAVSEVLRAAAATDDEVRERYLLHESMRKDAFLQVVRVLAEKGPLREGLTEGTATDVLLTVLGDSTYHLLAAERSWTHDRVVEWWLQELPRLILARPGDGVAPGDGP